MLFLNSKVVGGDLVAVLLLVEAEEGQEHGVNVRVALGCGVVLFNLVFTRLFDAITFLLLYSHVVLIYSDYY